jgi:hypothetical protein
MCTCCNPAGPGSMSLLCLKFSSLAEQLTGWHNAEHSNSLPLLSTAAAAVTAAAACARCTSAVGAVASYLTQKNLISGCSTRRQKRSSASASGAGRPTESAQCSSAVTACHSVAQSWVHLCAARVWAVTVSAFSAQPTGCSAKAAAVQDQRSASGQHLQQQCSAGLHSGAHGQVIMRAACALCRKWHFLQAGNTAKPGLRNDCAVARVL